MTHDHRTTMGAASRRLAMIMAAALLATLVPVAGAFAQPGGPDDDTDFEGSIEVSPEDDPNDGLAASARFAGASRLETAGLIATDDTDLAADFDTDELLVARADVFADALAGSFLGGLDEAPIVLSPSDTEVDEGELTPALKATIAINEPETITILGGPAAIGTDVEAALEESATVRRIGGVNRFETAALLADLAEETSTAILADGGNFPDALAAGAVAAGETFPILLTGNDGPLDPYTAERLDDLGIENVIAVGGTDALSDSVLDQVRAIVPDVERVSGPDRFQTAVAIAEYAQENFDFANTLHVNLARADDFADALALGPHAGLDFPGPSPILLTAVDELSSQTADYLAELASCDFEALHVAGGSFAVSDSAELEARDVLRPEGCTGTDVADIVLSPETATNLVGETHTVTATLVDADGEPATTLTEDDGTPYEVAFTTTSDDGAVVTPETSTAEVGDDGTAEFTFTGTTPGTVTVTGSSMDADGAPIQDTATKTFVAPDVTGLTATDTFAIQLSSADEVPPTEPDPGATGTAALEFYTLDDGSNVVCAELAVDQGTGDGTFAGAAGSHIHEAPAGEAGPIIVNLPTVDDDTNTAQGCSVTSFDLQEISDTPADYYVNVHTTEYPTGIVRGQLG